MEVYMHEMHFDAVLVLQACAHGMVYVCIYVHFTVCICACSFFGILSEPAPGEMNQVCMHACESMHI